MKKHSFILLFTLFLIFPLIANAQSMGDGVYYNGKIFMGNKTNSVGTAFVVHDGKFSYVGNDEEAKSINRNLPFIDMHRKSVIPSIILVHKEFALVLVFIDIDSLNKEKHDDCNDWNENFNFHEKLFIDTKFPIISDDDNGKLPKSKNTCIDNLNMLLTAPNK